MHPMCFPLLCYLNDVPRDSTNSDTVLHNYIWNIIDNDTDDRPNTDDCEKPENISVELGWWRKRFHPKAFVQYKSLWKEDSLLTTSGAKVIIGDFKENVEIGLISHKKDTDIGTSGTIGGTSTNQSSVVALFEFGLEENDNKIWWSK